MPIRRSRCDATKRRGAGILSASLPIDIIVGYDSRQVDIPARCVYQMIAAYRHPIAVSHRNDDVKIRIHERYSRCGRNSASMCHMHAVDVQEVIHAPEATDAAY